MSPDERAERALKKLYKTLCLCERVIPEDADIVADEIREAIQEAVAARDAEWLEGLDEETAQRISFAYGNTVLSNPDVKRGMVVAAVLKKAVAAETERCARVGLLPR